eukprot:768813-Hanusia_phi.AAC.12
MHVHPSELFLFLLLPLLQSHSLPSRPPPRVHFVDDSQRLRVHDEDLSVQLLLRREGRGRGSLCSKELPIRTGDEQERVAGGCWSAGAACWEPGGVSVQEDPVLAQHLPQVPDSLLLQGTKEAALGVEGKRVPELTWGGDAAVLSESLLEDHDGLGHDKRLGKPGVQLDEEGGELKFVYPRM